MNDRRRIVFPPEPEPPPEPKPKTLMERIAESEARKKQGPWVPACGGREEPFRTRSGRRLMYCWQESTGDHAYIDCDTDMILSDKEAFEALGTV